MDTWHERKQKSWSCESSLARKTKKFAFEVLTDTFCKSSYKKIPLTKVDFHTYTERKKTSRVHPGESLDWDDMTYHSRVYQISFWQIRLLWGGTAWWWERLCLKIGQGGLRDVWAGVYRDCLYRNVSGCYRSDGLFVRDNNSDIFRNWMEADALERSPHTCSARTAVCFSAL